MKLVYLAHPVTPAPGETLAGNLRAARALYKQLCLEFPDVCFIMPWIDHVEAFAGDKDDNPEMRRIGMERNYCAIAVCDELWLGGPRISNGMQNEANFARKKGVYVDLVEDMRLIERARRLAP